MRHQPASSFDSQRVACSHPHKPAFFGKPTSELVSGRGNWRSTPIISKPWQFSAVTGHPKLGIWPPDAAIENSAGDSFGGRIKQTRAFLGRGDCGHPDHAGTGPIFHGSPSVDASG